MLSDNLKSIMIKQKITLNQLAEMSDVPLETLRNIYYGKVSDPKVSTLLSISKSLHISINYLLGDNIHTPDEENLLRYFKRCGDHGKSVMLLIGYFESTLSRHERDAKQKFKIPCIVPLTMDNGIKYTESETIEVITDNPNAFIAIEITSNSFTPYFCKGDRVLLEDRFPINGEKAIFIKDCVAYCRTYTEHDNGYILKSLNRQGEDFKLKRMDEIKCMGTCIGVIRV